MAEAIVRRRRTRRHQVPRPQRRRRGRLLRRQTDRLHGHSGDRLRIRLLAAMEGVRLLGLLPGRRPRKFLDAHRPDARLHRPQQPRGQPLLRCLR